MFTGIVTGIGTVRKAVAGPEGLELTIQSPYRGLEPGESVSVDGACLTVEAATSDTFSVRVIRTTLDRRWKAAVLAAVGNTGFDYLALLCALRAVGAAPRPSLVVLAYASAELLAQIPFTPGGLGFVEAGLVGTLTLAGVPGPEALAATLLYRLVSYWLPIPVGGVAYLLLRHSLSGREDQHPSRG